MEKHLILLDLDGTLLDKESKISDFNKETLKKVRAQGHEVIIVTGRAHYRSHFYYEELDLNTLFINRNASHIHDPKNSTFKEMIEYLSKEALNKIFNGPIYDYIERLYYEDKNTIYVVKGNSDFYQYKLCSIKNSDIMVENDINLISMFIKKDKTKEVIEFLNTVEDITLEIFKAREEFTTTLIQVYPKISDKSLAINLLSDYYQVPTNRIIAIGDGVNDIGMIKEAHIGVAVANAIDEVKEVANIILDYSHDDSAVGRFLTEYFNLE